ncbi:FAD/FMN-containing dehydrogenase [Actinoplanes octamycinicus]|uniref:FAD/FMN-containing dehydrogenase n=1 Tax=Actinoplanes octamycinicus TaxID=135948 RepID=A0A7W7H049_9ACTN|nr:FAD-binding oxidoreductase [Actinoplanes octamycinicus]MBB4741515.1 FAD/FMN-containing dehydrogenase [Actinoplanes octamycinicus]GIE57065.1 FAD-linked oxidase [Actinoplanes octamycinicus]
MTIHDTVLTGAVFRPGEPGYDEHRLGWNRTVDSRPALIVAAATGADVRLALLAARERGLPLAVQATGHGLIAPADGALLLKTTALDQVTIDPERRTARVGPGARWADVNRAAARYGLAGLAGRCGTVGVTGYTLGGGQSWLSRTFGFAADSVLRADIVTADGVARTVSADEHPGLFWALRGGGGNFGLVTALEFRLYPVARVWCGMSFYPIERAFDTLAAYRDWAPGEPEAMNTAVLLLREPAAGRRVLAIRAFHHGDDGRRTLAPLLAAAGPPLVDAFAVRDFPAASQATNGPDAPPMPNRQEIEMLPGLPDDVLHAVVEAGSADSPLAFVDVRHWGGAMADPGPDAGPAGHRGVPFSVQGVAAYLSPDRGPVDAALDRLSARLRPHATGGPLLSLLTDPARTRAAFTPSNYARLTELKRTWDPDDVFHLGHHIPPATTRKDLR